MSRQTLVFALAIAAPAAGSTARADPYANPYQQAMKQAQNTRDQVQRQQAIYNWWAMQETARQQQQFAQQRAYLDQNFTEHMGPNNREQTNVDRPLKGARTLAGGPPKFIATRRPIRDEKLRFRAKGRAGGILTRMRSTRGNGGAEFDRIFSGGNGQTFDFGRLSQGAEGGPSFSFGLRR